MVTEAPAPTPDRRSGGQHGPRLFERGQFLDELDALFSQSLAVPSRCIAVEGPWGSGRTALLNAAADLAGLAGCLVLRTAGGGWSSRPLSPGWLGWWGRPARSPPLLSRSG